MARPSEYNYDLCVEICDELANGENIKRILASKPEYPEWTTFRRWKNEHEQLRTLYINSQQDKAIALENELDDLRDMLLSKEIDPSTYNTLAQTIKWKMAKFYPKVFGDKTQMEHSGEVKTNTTQIIVEITPPLEDE